MTDHPIHALIESLERKRIAAMLEADVATLDALLHADLLFGHTDGHADNKPAYLAKFTSGTVRYFDAQQQISSVRVIDNIALARSHLMMRAELTAGSRQLNVVLLTVWAMEAGSWKMIAHHPTVVDFKPETMPGRT